MASARRVYRFQVALAGAGAAVTAFVASVVFRAVEFELPSAARLLRACTSFVLPQITPVSVAVLVLGSISLAVVLRGARSLIGYVRAQRRVLRALGPVSPLKFDGAAIQVFDHPRSQAFCAGLVRPRIYVSAGALAALSPAPLAAVVAHERHHVRRRDPLRLLTVRVLSEALFFLPVLRRLADRYAELAEIAADEAAVRGSSHRRARLAAALLAFEESASPWVVGIAPERVDHLLGRRPGWELPIALLTWAAVITATLVSVAFRVAQASGSAGLNLPLLAAEFCMVTMAVAPLVIAASAVLLVRRQRATASVAARRLDAPHWDVRAAQR